MKKKPKKTEPYDYHMLHRLWCRSSSLSQECSFSSLTSTVCRYLWLLKWCFRRISPTEPLFVTMLPLLTKFSVNLSLHMKFHTGKAIVLSTNRNSGFALPGAAPFANQRFPLRKDSARTAPEAKRGVHAARRSQETAVPAAALR